MGKPWYRSKKFWVNAGAVVAGIGAIFTQETSLTVGIVPVIQGVVNIVLILFFTKEPITLKSK